MDIEEATEIMGKVKAFEDWMNADRPLSEGLMAAKELSDSVRAYVEGEAELGGWYTELMEEIGEYEAEFGEEVPEEASYTQGEDLTTGKWRVHLVMPGGHYGLSDASTYELEDAGKHGHGLPLVEFYDTSQDPARFPGGQFVSRYYMGTLLGMDPYGTPISERSALDLDGGIPAWTVSGDDLKRVAGWLEAANESLSADGERPVSLASEAKSSRDASEKLAGGAHDDVSLMKDENR